MLLHVPHSAASLWAVRKADTLKPQVKVESLCPVLHPDL